MSVVMMVTEDQWKANPDNIEVVHDYPGHRTGYVSHYKDCPHDRTEDAKKNPTKKYDDCHEMCWVRKPLYMETTWIGRVLETREWNTYHDSDFYAVVWDDDLNDGAGGTRRVEYATTRFWTYPNNAWVDATEEILEKYEKLLAKQRRAFHREKLARQRDAVEKDRTVEVVKGRKYEHGLTGKVFWVGQCRYGNGLRAGVKLDESGDKIWIAASILKVTGGWSDYFIKNCKEYEVPIEVN